MAFRNFDNQIVDFNGVALQEQRRNADGSIVLDAENGKPILAPIVLKDLIAKAVAEKHRGDEDLDFEQQYSRGKLARKIAMGGNVQLSLEEIALIKECVAKASFNTTIVVEEVARALEKEIPVLN